MESMVNFYKNKRVFVTGSTGFKGSWLCLMLKELGAIVTGYSLPAPTSPSMFELCNIEDKIDKQILGDVNNLKDLKEAVKGQDIVFHLAAQPIVIEAYENPTYTFQTNIMGTVNLLEACRHENIKTIICITTDKVYKNNNWEWGYRESDNLSNDDPYSASKGCCEVVISTYRKSYGLNVASCRAGNVIGGGDWGKYRLIPDIIEHIEYNKKLIIRNPYHTRPWQHVLEPLYGYLKLGLLLYIDKRLALAFNFAPNITNEINVKTIIKKFELNFDFKYIVEENNKYKECSFLKLDSSRVNKLLSWKAILDLDQTLNLTISWYRDYMNRQDLYKKTIDQIKDYYANTLC